MTGQGTCAHLRSAAILRAAPARSRLGFLQLRPELTQVTLRRLKGRV